MSRSRGGLSANDNDDKNASNDNRAYDLNSLDCIFKQFILPAVEFGPFTLRRKCCLCNDICKLLDFLVFSDKDDKP